MVELLWVGMGGFVGAVLRYSLSHWVQSLHQTPFPAGTLVVNVLGCFAIGVLTVVVDRGALLPEARLFLGAGLLGALTTFSTFSWETLELIRDGALASAAVNVLANVVVGMAAVTAGFLVGRSL